MLDLNGKLRLHDDFKAATVLIGTSPSSAGSSEDSEAGPAAGPLDAPEGGGTGPAG